MPLLPFEKIERTVLVKKHAETNPAHGFFPDKRPLEMHVQYGVINIDKPEGPTTHQVSDYVQKILHISKSGHGGTLDPAVTGLVLVALEKCTKVVHALLHAGKEYVCLMRLHGTVPEEEIRKKIIETRGIIKQLPPVKSSVKRVWREREIYYMDILEMNGLDVLFIVGCQAGTYIRKLCHDIGKALGVGAHMAELRRTKIGPFKEDTACSLQTVQDAYVFWKEDGNETHLRTCVQPMEASITHLSRIWLLDTTIDSLCHGAKLNIPGIAKLHDTIKRGDLVGLLSLKGELVALATAQLSSNEIMMQEKGTAATVESVFMPIGVYPRMDVQKET